MLDTNASGREAPSNELMAHTYSNLFDVPVKLMEGIKKLNIGHLYSTGINGNN